MIGDKISLCLIVKNEEQYLKRCVESVQSLVDETIIVDTGSTDRTVEIAKSLTSNIYIKPFQNDFSEARNYAISKARYEWILFLDADEFFYEEEVSRIKSLLSSGISDNVGGIKFYVYNFFNTGGWFTGHVLRLFRNKMNFKYQNPVGERIEPSILANKFLVIEPDIILTHTGHCKSYESRVRKTEKYIEICDEQIRNDSTNYMAYSYKGINLRNNGRMEEALECVRIGVENNPKSFLANSFFGSVSRSLGMHSEALQAYKIAEYYAPLNMKSIMKNNVGLILLSEGKYSEALAIFQQAYRENPIFVHILLNIGITHYFNKSYSEALDAFEKVLERNPHFYKRERDSFFHIDPFQAYTYETIYGYPGLEYFINKIKNS